MMRIGLLHYSSLPVVGGVENVVADHARLMTEAGHSVRIISGRGAQFAADIPVHIHPLINSRHPEILEIKDDLDLGTYSERFDLVKTRLRKILEKELATLDVLIAHNIASLNKNLPLTAALYDIALTDQHVKIILWNHDLAWTMARYQSELYEKYPWQLLKTAWPNCQQVVISSHRRDDLASLTNLDRKSIQVIPNGIDLNLFHKLEPQTQELLDKFDLLDADPLFLLPVRITPRKNIELAVRIIAELKKELPNVMLLVTGPEGPHNPANTNYKNDLHRLILEMDLVRQVIMLADHTTEFTPYPVIADLYRLADALLIPSRDEGFGIPIIEAGFSAMPVFCSDIAAFKELGNGDITYFNVDGDPHSIAAQIQNRLSKEKTLRWSRKIKHEYNWKSIYAHYIEPLFGEEK